MWATYEEWKQLGRHVRKGQVSRLRDPQGTPLFKFNQTDKSPTYHVIWTDE
jgi:hypothetical protein